MRYYFLLAKSILSKDILYIRRYWLNSVFSVFIMIVFFIGLTYGIDNMSLEYDSNGSSFLGGYVVWIFTTSCFSTMVNNISTEANLGTLEQLYINSKFFYSTLILQAFSSFFILLVQITLLIFILSSFRIVEFEYLNNYSILR